jgi:hypothetical protein
MFQTFIVMISVIWVEVFFGRHVFQLPNYTAFLSFFLNPMPDKVVQPMINPIGKA